jgi:hypothetical protein
MIRSNRWAAALPVLALLASLASLLSLASCSHGKELRTSSAKVTENPWITISALELKDKSKKYDIELVIRNKSDRDIIIYLRDMQCYRGEIPGMLKHTFFNTGERTIDFHRGQMKKFRLVCDLGTKQQGAYKIVVGRVFDNPEGDGSTKGKVLAQSIEWNLPAGAFEE